MNTIDRMKRARTMQLLNREIRLLTYSDDIDHRHWTERTPSEIRMLTTEEALAVVTDWVEKDCIEDDKDDRGYDRPCRDEWDDCGSIVTFGKRDIEGVIYKWVLIFDNPRLAEHIVDTAECKVHSSDLEEVDL